MPHTPRHHRPTTGTVSVPAAILLPAAGTGGRPGRLPAGRLGVDATCRLVATYTRTGDRVADLDGDPNTTAAVVWLDRQPLTVDIGDHPTPPPSLPAAQLVIARLPRVGVHGLAGITAWMRHVREHLLAPGGYLIAIVTPTIRAGRYLDRATTVIAAAQAAGLSWQQQLLHIRTPLPADEHTNAAAAATGTRLARGRHQRLHDDLFVLTAGGVDA